MENINICMNSVVILLKKQRTLIKFTLKLDHK